MTNTNILSPLKVTVFRNIWIANLVSNIGTWMHDMGAGWLMTLLSPEPLMVSLVQTSLFLPSFFLILPSGALADLVDRRKVLIVSISWMLLIAFCLGSLTLMGYTTPYMLLSLTFGLGVGSAIFMPAMASIIPDLVPKTELVNALTLNSIAQNMTRAIGPAIAGFLIALSGPWIVFMVNALSFSLILLALLNYQHQQPRSALPSEKFFGAMTTGVSYVRQSPEIKTVLCYASIFFFMLSSIFAFLPLIVRVEMDYGPKAYGFMLTCMGIGAVITGISLPRIRIRVKPYKIIQSAFIVGFLCILTLALIRNLPILLVCMCFVGFAWISMISTMQITLQLSLPNWIRARGLSMFYATFMGSMAFGGLFWGYLASITSIKRALLISLIFGIVMLLLIGKRKLPLPHNDAAVSDSLLEGHLSLIPSQSDVQVMINVEYLVSSEDQLNFENTMRDVRRMRLRNGAIAWGLYLDLGTRNRYVEHFMDQSWVEHLRRHERQTQDDEAILNAAYAFHQSTDKPKVSHFTARSAPRRLRPWLKK
jgi:MFS family permease